MQKENIIMNCGMMQEDIINGRDDAEGRTYRRD